MKVEQVVPILNVSDVEASVAWFGKLGWDKGFEWRLAPDGPVEFGAVTAGGSEIFLCHDGQGGRGRVRAGRRGRRRAQARGAAEWMPQPRSCSTKLSGTPRRSGSAVADAATKPSRRTR